jgi:hypothetical protein
MARAGLLGLLIVELATACTTLTAPPKCRLDDAAATALTSIR